MSRNKINLLLVLMVLTSAACSAETNASNRNTETNTTVTNHTINMKTTINLTKADFLTKVANFEQNPNEWKYLGDKPCIIDFYADWCGPCKVIAPILEEIGKEYEGQVYVYKVNTETEQDLAAAFGIRSIPSLLFVPMNGQPQMAQGALPKETLRKAIQEVLLAAK